MNAQDIKSRIALSDVFDKYGIQKQATGARYLCPFHADSRPSMTIKYENFNCWACGAKGDAITFVRDYFNLTFGEALQKLNDDFALGLAPTGPKIKHRRDKLDAVAEYMEREEKQRKNERISKLRAQHRKLIRAGLIEEAAEVAAVLDRLEGVRLGQ